MKILYRRCAGMDVHKKTVSVCIRVRKAGNSRTDILTRQFGTTMEDLLSLRSWLRLHKVKQVAMESTGIYWVPVWSVLERSERKFELVLINPQHVRALPGKKTDQQDCERIAELLQHGLLQGSFVPPPATREQRDLTRMRTHLQQDRNRAINRISRLLETANCKLTSVVTRLTGKTGRLILRAIAEGTANPDKLAELAQGSLQLKKEELARALKGFYTEHFRWLLRQRLSELDRLDERLDKLDRRISEKTVAQADLIRRLCTIPGVQLITAQILLAEAGTDMSKFPDAAHLASWAGLCPGNHESAGKRQSGRTRKGNRYLRRVLVQNAWAVCKMKDGGYLTGTFYRIAARCGMKKAAVAIAHKILVIAYYIIRDGETYHDLGGNYHDQRHRDRTVHRLTRRLEALGVSVALTERETLPAVPAEPAVKKKKRGRPCHCLKRGIICIHGT